AAEALALPAGAPAALVRRDDAVDAAPPHVVDGLRRHVHLRALPRRLPGVVRLRIVERVRPDAGPVALGILAHVDEARAARQADEARVETDATALVLVDLGEPRIADRREEPAAEARGPACCTLGRAAHQDHRR